MNLGLIDTDTIASYIRKAVEEDPKREAHGDTRYNSFFVTDDGEVVPRQESAWLRRSAPGDPAPDTVSVHSHSAENWRWYEELTGEKEPFNPLNAGDLKALQWYVAHGVANTQALIMGDGRMQVLHVPPEAQERFSRLRKQSITKGIEGSPAKRAELYSTVGLTAEGIERRFLRSFAKKHGLELYEGLRWREPEPEPLIKRKRRGVVPEKMHTGKPIEQTAAYNYYVSGHYKLVPPEVWPIVPTQPELEIERKGQKYTWQKARPEPSQMRFFGLGLAPASVWQSTLTDFTARTPKGDYPGLPPQLNWMLQRTKVNPEGLLRVFRGRLPGHMQRKLREWLWGRYQHPERLGDAPIKIDFRDGRRQNDYVIHHPFYSIVVTFYNTGTVQVTENRGNYHAESVREAIAQGKAVPVPVLNEYAPYMKEAEEALYSRASIPEQMEFLGTSEEATQMRFFGLGKAAGMLSVYWFFIPKGRTKPRLLKGDEMKGSMPRDKYLEAGAKNTGRLYHIYGWTPKEAEDHLEEILARDRKYRKDWGGKFPSRRHPGFYSWKRGYGYYSVRLLEDQMEAYEREYLTEKKKPLILQREAQQMQFFGLGNNGLSGRLFHCMTWQVNPYTGDLRCETYATACQAKEACVAEEPRGRLRVCVTPKMVYSKHYKKKVQRCAKYNPICGPGCITTAGPKPARVIEPSEKEIRAVAEWFAEEEAGDLPGYDPKLLAHEILSRGGLRAYRKQYPGQKTDEEYMELPLFLKKKTGLPPDEMASEMGFDTDSELYEAIHRAYPPKTAKTALQKKLERRKSDWRQFENRAYQYLITERRREAGLEGRRS